MPTFRYEDLPGAEHIRLLEVNSQPDSDRNSIRGVLKTISIRDCPDYVAVSYRWRSNDEYEEILLDGKIFKIRKNLLRLLQTILVPGESLVVWIDAICIDQNNLEERASQVRIMKKVFSRAIYALAWFDNINPEIFQTAADFLTTTTSGDVTAVQKALHSEDGWFALEQLLLADYWSRTWIVREVLVPESVILQCSSSSLPLTYLEDMIVRVAGSLPKDSLPDRHWKQLADTDAVRLCAHRSHSRSSPLMTFKELLQLYAHFECTDVRDKVYALIDLCRPMPDAISVDYNHTRGQVLIGVMQSLVRSNMLDADSVMSMFSMLIQQLFRGLTLEQQLTQIPMMSLQGPDLSVRLVIRGYVISDFEHRAWHNGTDICREYATGLRTVYGRLLQANNLNDYTLRTSDASDGSRVEPDRLFDFTIHGSLAPMGPRAEALIGMMPSSELLRNIFTAGISSAPLQLNDEVWQFHDTETALIVRRSKNHIAIVGQALMIKNWRRAEFDWLHKDSSTTMTTDLEGIRSQLRRVSLQLGPEALIRIAAMTTRQKEPLSPGQVYREGVLFILALLLLTSR